ncbi:MAG: FKBP-type peptidyl-prolyl cis-trans isomerase [Candidatus Paceibacterota bacterium]|jgi:FKBP-type peptidyl-prolyl cis-trans isomerase
MNSKYGKNIAIGIAVLLAIGVFVYLGIISFNSDKNLSGDQSSTIMNSDKNNSAPINQVITTASGLIITETLLGKGVTAESGMAVAVHYTGTLTDGTVFDSSYKRGEPIQFLLGKGMVISGWDEGITGMKVGGKRHLVIPPSLAYGANGIKDPATGKDIIPANSTLIFDVELMATAKVDPTTGQIIQ